MYILILCVYVGLKELSVIVGHVTSCVLIPDNILRACSSSILRMGIVILGGGAGWLHGGHYLHQ